MTSQPSITELKRWPDVLRRWAAMGAALLPAHPKGFPDWTPVHRLIQAAREKLKGDKERLVGLLKRSREMLKPLEEPFDINLGLHRWLRAEREEAYSDWLAWVVEQMPGPEQVFRLLGLGNPPADAHDMGKPTVQREVCIPQGNEGQEGRLDLVIRYGGQAIIVVEVKKGDAEGADTTKQEGYSKWIDKQPEAARYPVMLVTSADDEICKGFVSLPWANVCIELRRLSIEIIHERRVTTAAMILAFVAAVEQNLLGFSYETVQRISEEEGLLFNVEVVDYVEKFVNRMEE